MAALGAQSESAGLPPQTLRFASLDTGAVPLERLRAANATALQRALERATDARECALVLPHRLTTLLTHVFPNGLASLSTVIECVELTDDLAKVHCSAVVYITLPQVEDVRAIATHAGLLLSVQPKERSFSLIVAGKWTSLCAEALAHQQLSDLFHVEVADMGFVPLDSDLVTLGRERCLYDCFVHGNKSVLVDTASALCQLQQLYGSFEHIKYKGELSAFVFQQLMQQELLDRESAAVVTRASPLDPKAKNKTKNKNKNNTMHTLVILDRSVDFASALSTPLTLEALVDELFESRDGFATLSLVATDDSLDGALPTHTEHVLALNASDPIYHRVRGLNIQAVTSTLHQEASAIKTKFDGFMSTSATAATADVHEFVKSVPALKVTQQSLERLVSLAETVAAATHARGFRSQWHLERLILDSDVSTDHEPIFDEIEDMVFRHAPLLAVLRVLCLYSVTHDGVPPTTLMRLKMRFVQAYGHELVFSFENLARVGLLRAARAPPSLVDVVTNGGGGGGSSSSSGTVGFWSSTPLSSFAEIATVLKAIDLDVDPLNPGSMAFVTSGYAPLSCLLVEELLKHGHWQALDPVLHRLRGPRAEVVMKARKPIKKQKSKSTENDATTARRVLVVCIVGGVTYMEIAALRWLKQFYPLFEIVITSTSIMNGHSFLDDVLERIPSTT